MDTLLYNEDKQPAYDEATLHSLELTRDNMISGKEKTYTLQQTIENIQKFRNKI